MRLAMALSPLLVLAMAATVDGQLFKNLQKIDPTKVAVPLAKKTPAELVQAVKEKAEASVPKDPVGKIQDAVKGSSAEDVKDSAIDSIGDALQDITGKSNVSDLVDATAGAISQAGAALQQGGKAIANANASHVKDSLKDAGAKAMNATGLAKVKDALEKASAEDVASQVRKVTPQVAKKVNQTGERLQETFKQASPKAVGFLNRTGNGVADALAPKRIPNDPIDGEDDGSFGQRSWVGLGGLALLVVVAAVGYAISLRFKTSSRSPMLLSDALDTMGTGGGARDSRAVQMTTQEPFFSKF